MKNIYHSLIILCLVMVCRDTTYAQHKYDTGISGFYSSNGNSPFWNQANQLGFFPDQSPSLITYFSISSDFKRDSTGKYNRPLDWGYGLNGGAILSEKGVKGVLPIAYLKAKIWEFEITAGRMTQFTGLTGDTTLTSGSFAISGNSLPVPGIRFAIPEFRTFRFSQGWLAMKAHYSESFLGNNFLMNHLASNINNTALHSKAMTFRIGNDAYPVKLFVGANHQVMWGGNPEKSDDQMISSSIGTYKDVISGKSGENLLIGEHIGSVDLGVEFTDYSWTYFLYRQNFYEQDYHNKKMNWQDGLTGIEIRRHNFRPTTAFHINTALIEFISTMNKKDLDISTNALSVRPESYYNHSFYRSGWAYKGRGLGNPLLAPGKLVKEEHISDNDYLTVNNRIIAVHTGLKGAFYKIPWMVKATYSRNSGTYTSEFIPALDQVSFIMNVEVPLRKFWGTRLQMGISGDIGELYHNNFAVNIGLRKSGIL